MKNLCQKENPMAKPDKSIDKMDEDMKGLDHNGMLQRQWKMLRQVLERNAEAGADTPNEDSDDPSEAAEKTEKNQQ